jgi:hypothetical protein
MRSYRLLCCGRPGLMRSFAMPGYRPRFESRAMAIHFFGPDDERGTNGNIHFGCVGRRPPLQLSRREFRLMTCYHCGIVAIETFIRPFAQVRARRSFSDKHHRCAAIRARMNVKFVGREAKERVRRGHIALLRSISREVDANRCWLAVHIKSARAIDLRTQHRAQKKRRSVGPPLLRMGTDLLAPPHHL